MLKRIIILSLCFSSLFSVSAVAYDVMTEGGLYATSADATGMAVWGIATNPGAYTNWGGFFVAAGDAGHGAEGRAFGANGRGVYGYATGTYGAGVYGYATGTYSFGVYGASTGASSRGVYGTSSNDTGVAVAGDAFGANGTGIVGNAPPTGHAGWFNGRVYVNGDLSASGTKPFIQPHKKDPSKEVVYVAAEGPEVMVFFRGAGVLKNGKAVIKLPEYFSMVASEQGVQVQVTPTEACNGSYVAKQGRESIEVRELNRGRHSVGFNYLVTGVRAGFEGHQPVADNTHFRPGPNETAKAFEDRYKGDTINITALRAMLTANGILTSEGKLNRDVVAKLGWTVKEEDIALLSK